MSSRPDKSVCAQDSLFCASASVFFRRRVPLSAFTISDIRRADVKVNSDGLPARTDGAGGTSARFADRLVVRGGSVERSAFAGYGLCVRAGDTVAQGVAISEANRNASGDRLKKVARALFNPLRRAAGRVLGAGRTARWRRPSWRRSRSRSSWALACRRRRRRTRPSQRRPRRTAALP
jgi:hypothetical protein